MTKKEMTLAMLTEAADRGVTSREFYDAGIFRYSARIEELRKAGHNIDTVRTGKGQFRYKLLSRKPGPPTGATPYKGESQQVHADSAAGEQTLAADPLPLFETAPTREARYTDPDQRAA